MPSIITHPADSAFVRGSMLLSEGDITNTAAQIPVQWGESVLINVLCLILVLCALACLRRLLNVLPSILACMLRYKEIITLAESAKLVRDRDLVMMVSILPFCLLVARYALWDVAFMSRLSPVMQFLVVVGVFLCYVIVRFLMQLIAGRGRMSPKIYKAGNQSSRVFLILGTGITMATAGIMELFGQSDPQIVKVLYWEIALIFTLFALRKSQIFLTGCSFFSTFLYLCALEILPAVAVAFPVLYWKY